MKFYDSAAEVVLAEIKRKGFFGEDALPIYLLSFDWTWSMKRVVSRTRPASDRHVS